LAQAPDPLVERALLEMFRRTLDEAGDNDPPHPTGDARLAYAVWDDTYRLTIPFRMPDGRIEEYHSAIAAVEVMRGGRGRPRSETRYAIGSMWSRCYEDHYMHRMERAAMVSMAQAPSREVYEIRRSVFDQFREHVSGNHAVPSPFMPPEPRHQTATEVRRRQEIVERSVHRMSRQFDDAVMAAFGNVSSQVADAPAAELTYETILQAAQRLADFRSQNHWADHWRDAFLYGQAVTRVWLDEAANLNAEAFNPEVGTKEAQARGLQLLKENLTPEQLASYEKNKHFDVKGGETGKTYRIRHGRQMNITELDANGNRVGGICFLPQGGLVSGDCMLAQKTALELFETEALGIANRFA
jgi:hypothetical protein